MTARSDQKEAKTDRDVLIQGAGIGGLTLAIALQKLGYSVRLVERATALAEVGAGIWMAANAMQVFDRLGFADSIVQAGWTVRELRLQDWNAGDLQRTDLSELAQAYGFETIALERTVLQRVLFEQLYPGTVQFNCQVKSVAEARTRRLLLYRMVLPAGRSF